MNRRGEQLWQDNISSGVVLKLARTYERQEQYPESLMLCIRQFLGSSTDFEVLLSLSKVIKRLYYRLGNTQFCLVCKVMEFPPENLVPLILLAENLASTEEEMNLQLDFSYNDTDRNCADSNAEFLQVCHDFLQSVKRGLTDIQTSGIDTIRSKQAFQALLQMRRSWVQMTMPSDISNISAEISQIMQNQQYFCCWGESLPSPSQEKLADSFSHLHLPLEYVRTYSDNSLYEEGVSTSRQGIRDNNPYAFFRYLRTLRGHSGSVYALAFASDKETLASSSADRTIKLWNLITCQERCTLTGHTDAVVSLLVLPKENTLVSGSADTNIKLWNLHTGQAISHLVGHTHSVVCLACSPDSAYIASGSADTTIRLWDLNTHQFMQTLRGHAHTVLSIAISPDGKTLASASSDCTIKLWELTTGQEIRTLEANAGIVFSVRFHPEGQMLLSIHDGDKTIKFWDLHTGEVFRTISTNVEIASVAVTPDWTTLAGGGSDMSYVIGLWNLFTGRGITYFGRDNSAERARSSIYHSGDVYTVAFSPDGQILASGSRDTTIKLWGIPQPLRIE